MQGVLNPTVTLLEFDPTYGPVVTETIGDLNMTDEEQMSLLRCAFPDSAVQIADQDIVFVFKVGPKFCYSLFVCRQDPNAVRGHKQYTFVIISTKPYIYLFTRLLHSSRNIQGSPHEILTFTMDFLQKWEQSLPLHEEDVIEFPMFDGSLPVSVTGSRQKLLKMNGGIGWNPLCSLYYLNDTFVDFAIEKSLLVGNGIKKEDVFELWEAVLLGENILVYGADPTITSSAVLCLASLSFPYSYKGSIHPFVSVSDSRFMKLVKDTTLKSAILGISNPIALQYQKVFKHIFIVGFQSDSNGLLKRHSVKRNTTHLRRTLYTDNLMLAKIIHKGLDKLRISNPYAEFSGQISIEDFKQDLIDCNIPFINSLDVVAKHLVHSPFFVAIWKQRCTRDVLSSILPSFSIENWCDQKTEHELIDQLSLIVEIRKIYGDSVELCAFIDRDYEITKSFLSSDLVLAPI